MTPWISGSPLGHKQNTTGTQIEMLGHEWGTNCVQIEELGHRTTYEQQPTYGGGSGVVHIFFDRDGP